MPCRCGARAGCPHKMSCYSTDRDAAGNYRPRERIHNAKEWADCGPSAEDCAGFDGRERVQASGVLEAVTVPDPTETR